MSGQYVLACPKVVGHFRILVGHVIIVLKILYFLVTRLGVLGHNIRAVSQFYTRTAKKCPDNVPCQTDITLHTHARAGGYVIGAGVHI